MTNKGADNMNKQAILDVLNSLEVTDSQGGEDAYALVDNTPEVRDELNALGITDETIEGYGDKESFCILALAFGEGYADYHQSGKLFLFGPIDDDLRQRVVNGEGTAIDAERLLRALEPELFGEVSHDPT